MTNTEYKIYNTTEKQATLIYVPNQLIKEVWGFLGVFLIYVRRKPASGLNYNFDSCFTSTGLFHLFWRLVLFSYFL